VIANPLVNRSISEIGAALDGKLEGISLAHRFRPAVVDVLNALSLYINVYLIFISFIQNASGLTGLRWSRVEPKGISLSSGAIRITNVEIMRALCYLIAVLVLAILQYRAF
jgi:hypothetical protein